MRFSRKVVDGFEHGKYELVAESYETTWGFKSTSGKYFKISNRDLANALADIVANWEEWQELDLEVNSENPDVTLADFSRDHFSEGAHKDLAEVQRRGFLHLINTVAHASRNDGAYGADEWDTPLEKADYEAALEVVREYSEQAKKMAGMSQTPASPSPAPPRVTGGENVLYYGAPGTGKSHNVWQRIDKDTDPHFVTVFHPDMQNSDFAGTLKPGLDDGGDVTYQFRPGPFANAVASAWANPGKKVYLVIEELNRAVAAAVFGELFQLLDRNSDGSSCYKVDFPSPEFAKWFAERTGSEAAHLSLPSNFWILATMNSADQGVYPLDTAFRRRWRQNYLAIDYSKAPEIDLEYVSEAGPKVTDWRTFVEALNRYLVAELDIREDRLIGPRFLSEDDLDDGKLPGKLLIYLWDDLLRHHSENALFDQSIATYGDLHRRLNKPEKIFSSQFLSTLSGGSQPGEDSDVTDNPSL